MDQCPKCKMFTFAYDRINNRFVCLNLKCSHIEAADVKNYKRENNILQKLAV